MRATHTYAILQVSRRVYEEIRAKLDAVGYQQAFHLLPEGEVIDMHGIAIQASEEAMSDLIPLTLFPGEVEAVRHVLQFAEQYGYGNLISHLRRAWALYLIAGNPALSYERAIAATNVAAYPEGASIDALQRWAGEGLVQ